ncbi:MAG TPA: DUF4382 domain-containing protein [Candidatus Angelobacter sp.]|jgi:hypothetical protein
MGKTKWFSGTILLAMAIVLSGCGTTGSNTTTPPPPPPPGSSNLTVFATDAAADNVLAFKVDVTSISVTDSSGKSTTLTTTPQTLELRHLQLAPTVALQAANLPSGQYNSISVTLANPELAVFSAGTVSQKVPTLSSSTVSIPLTNFSLPSGGTQGLALDFDLNSSISTNASGGFVVSPVIHPVAVSSSSAGMELVDSVGQISAMPSNPAKSFDYQLMSGAATARVVTDANTVFDGGITSFANLQVGQYVEVDGQFQSDGTFLAKYVELSASNPGLRVQGVVAAVSTTTTGTSLSLVVQD